MTTNDDLRALIQELSTKVDGLGARIAKLELLTKEVAPDHLVVIAAAVAAYLGETKAARRQPRYASEKPSWSVSSQTGSQSAHLPSPR